MFKKLLLIILATISIQHIDAKQSAVDFLYDCTCLYGHEEGAFTPDVLDSKLKDFIKQGGDINEVILNADLAQKYGQMGMECESIQEGRTTLLTSFAALRDVRFVEVVLSHGANPLQEVQVDMGGVTYTGTVLDGMWSSALFGCACCDVPTAYQIMYALVSHVAVDQRKDFLDASIKRLAYAAHSIWNTLSSEDLQQGIDGIDNWINEYAAIDEDIEQAIQSRDTLSEAEKCLLDMLEKLRSCYAETLSVSQQKDLKLSFIQDLLVGYLQNAKKDIQAILDQRK